MKLFFLSALLVSGCVAAAQPKLVSSAIVSTTTNIIAPEDEDVSQIQSQGQGGGFNMRNFGDGETKTTTYIKNDLVKTAVKSETFRGSIFRNNTAKTTVTIYEVMGNKGGFSASDDDQVDMRKKADSMMKERAKADTGMQRRTRNYEAPPATVSYTEESKKIAGFNCKKAFVITDKLISKDTQVILYTPDIKFANVSSTGGTSGFGGMLTGANPFDRVDGFVMQYERKMPRGRLMEVKVTKIETEKEISDKEFEVPKDVEIKTMKEMGQGGPGGMRMMRP